MIQNKEIGIRPSVVISLSVSSAFLISRSSSQFVFNASVCNTCRGEVLEIGDHSSINFKFGLGLVAEVDSPPVFFEVAAHDVIEWPPFWLGLPVFCLVKEPLREVTLVPWVEYEQGLRNIDMLVLSLNVLNQILILGDRRRDSLWPIAFAFLSLDILSS